VGFLSENELKIAAIIRKTAKNNKKFLINFFIKIRLNIVSLL